MNREGSLRGECSCKFLWSGMLYGSWRTWDDNSGHSGSPLHHCCNRRCQIHWTLSLGAIYWTLQWDDFADLDYAYPKGKCTPASEGVKVCGALSETVASAPVAALTALRMHVDARVWKLN